MAVLNYMKRQRVDPSTHVIFLYLTSTKKLLLGSPERQTAVVELLRAVAAETNPAGGEVSFKSAAEVGAAGAG